MSLKKEEFYCPEDFASGETINVFGRECQIYDADDFTKAYYRYKLGIELNFPQQEQV